MALPQLPTWPDKGSCVSWQQSPQRTPNCPEMVYCIEGRMGAGRVRELNRGASLPGNPYGGGAKDYGSPAVANVTGRGICVLVVKAVERAGRTAGEVKSARKTVPALRTVEKT